MRRFLELTVMAATAVLLVATERERTPCPVETLNLRADSTCGPSANIVVTSRVNCTVTASGADLGGLPTTGAISSYLDDAGPASGFTLSSPIADGGGVMNCTATPADGGFAFRCRPDCFSAMADGGGGTCGAPCDGTFTPQ
jgi:hypothetical protein